MELLSVIIITRTKPQADAQPTPTAKPAGFAVTSAVIESPQIVYNNDKLGTSNKACRVKATITVSAPGTVTYYRDTYDPQYFSPSNQGSQETKVFNTAGTQTVTLETYVSDDNRRFSLVVVSPNQVTKEIGTQVWCPK